MKKILLYSETHEPYLETFVTILNLMGNKEIFIATNEKRVDWLLETNPNLYSNVKFIKLNESLSFKKTLVKASLNLVKNYLGIKKAIKNNKIDNFVVLEIYNEKLQFIMSFDFSFKNLNKILTIHNIHRYFKVDANLIKKYNLQSPKKFQIRFLRKFNKIVVLQDNLAKTLKVKYGIDSIIIPYKLTKPIYIEKRKNFLEDCNKQKIKFVVPGNVDSKRKNYYSIVDTFSVFSKESYELVFLGKVIERDIIDYAKKKNINLKYFDSYLSENEFNNEIISSHFLIGLISNELPYGELKASGVVFDGASLGVPVIINNENLVLKNGLFIVTQNLESTLKEITKDFETSTYYEKYGKPALDKMIENKAEKYISNMEKLLE
jgi:hypothetical protein